MSTNSKMLIDATHPEETRVVVQRNGRVEEFDFESAARKLLRGNIYLAKVTRVEPSLQAAFVDYGGNRHGFLAFNEIHPDYYQIPVADRQALIDEEAAAEAELEAAADRRAEALERRARQRGPGGQGGSGGQDGGRGLGRSQNELPSSGDGDDADSPSEMSNIVDVEEDEHIEEIGGENGEEEGPSTFAAASVRDESISEPLPAPTKVDAIAEDRPGFESGGAAGPGDTEHHDNGDDTDDGEDDAEDDDEEEGGNDGEDDAGAEMHHHQRHAAGHDHDHVSAKSGGQGDAPESTGGSDMLEEVPVRQRRRPRSYKIQEVIKRRQVILVQVVKEERGNKGAALTTYLSLAGRYTVLMPNTARGGGISRKITNPQDRKRLKSIAQELDVPEGMGLIIRTAGAARTKQEIKRDFEYLLRLWESVRDLTLQSTAPSLVYEEGDLIKRSIRDLYNKDVEEVVVAGDGGYREAADFMHMLLPSHSKHVVAYNEPTPLFAKYGVERQLNAMFSPQVTLRSGGYIVINQTEALVAIDVNSGKSTREFSIEETALATNLEASDEIARQLKLRDLAGLIVIDFIDMEEKRNNRAVERRLKDALRHDRARIQLGRISHFGLMEMSRQRLRTGVLEGSTSQCQHCQGTGIIRSTESVALAVLRGLEDAITAGSDTSLIATTTTAVALYILNSKRSYVADMEARHGYSVTVLGSDRVHGANFTVERGLPTAIAQRRPERAAVNMDWGFEGEDEAEAPGFEGGAIEDVATEAEGGDEGGGRERQQARDNGDGDASKPGSRRKRRRRGGRRGERGDEAPRTGAGSAGGEASDDLDDVATGGIEDIADVGDRDDADQGETVAGAADSEENNERRRRRRRGRRGGRRGRGERDGGEPRAEGQALSNDSSGDGSSSGMETSDDFADDGDAEPRVTAPGLEPQPDVGMELAPQASPGGRQRHRGERGGERGDERGARGDRPEREPRRRPDRIWDVPKDTAGEAGDGEPAQAAEQPLTASRPDSRPEARTHSRPDTRPQTEHPSTAEARSETETHKAQTGGNVETRHPAIPEAPADSGEREPAPRRHETGSSEPRLERVVVRPGQTGDGSVDGSVDSSSEASPAPQRKGWWQRKFGGE